jgi:hypothetical protein
MERQPVKQINVAIIATVAAVAGVYLATRAARAARAAAVDAAGVVGNAINPVNQNNVFYSGVNAVGGAIVQDPAGPGKNADGSWTLGGWLFDVTHPNAWKF